MFFSLKQTVKARKMRILISIKKQHLFAKQELITRARLRPQDFVTGKNFSFNQCHNKEFGVISWESYFIKAIENFFPVFASGFAQPDMNTRGIGRIRDRYANPRRKLFLFYCYTTKPSHLVGHLRKDELNMTSKWNGKQLKVIITS